MPSFNEARGERCPQCGGKVVYQYGNWHCGGYKTGCGWTTARDVSAPRDKPLNGGMITLEHCPRCGGRVMYNGNYFCESWGQDCEWALPHPPQERADRAMAMRLIGSAS